MRQSCPMRRQGGRAFLHFSDHTHAEVTALKDDLGVYRGIIWAKKFLMTVTFTPRAEKTTHVRVYVQNWSSKMHMAAM